MDPAGAFPQIKEFCFLRTQLSSAEMTKYGVPHVKDILIYGIRFTEQRNNRNPIL